MNKSMIGNEISLMLSREPVITKGSRRSLNTKKKEPRTGKYKKEKGRAKQKIIYKKLVNV